MLCLAGTKMLQLQDKDATESNIVTFLLDLSPGILGRKDFTAQTVFAYSVRRHECVSKSSGWARSKCESNMWTRLLCTKVLHRKLATFEDFCQDNPTFDCMRMSALGWNAHQMTFSLNWLMHESWLDNVLHYLVFMFDRVSQHNERWARESNFAFFCCSNRKESPTWL